MSEEYSLVICRPGVEPWRFRTSRHRRVIEAELEQERERYRQWEPDTRIELYVRSVGEWRPVPKPGGTGGEAAHNPDDAGGRGTDG